MGKKGRNTHQLEYEKLMCREVSNNSVRVQTNSRGKAKRRLKQKKKRLNKKKSKENQKCIDHSRRVSISQLPDDILTTIASHLTMKEAARTSILGSRWRYLWKKVIEYRCVLEFEDTHMLQNSGKKISIMDQRFRYINWVNTVINLHSNSTIEEFLVRFGIDNQFDDDIDNWVDFALRKKVKRIEFDFTMIGKTYLEDCYHFPDIHERVNGLSSLSFLVTLCLKYVNVTDQVLDYLISNSPCIEELCVEGALNLEYIKISNLSLRLKYLQVRVCKNLIKMEICAPNLISFTYYGCENVFYDVENFPPLVNLSIEFFTMRAVDFTRICSLFPHLETLTLGRASFPMEIPHQVPVLPKLTKLVLRVEQNWLTCFHVLIDLFPYLSELTLEFSDLGKFSTSKFVGQSGRGGDVRIHECLKVIKVKGFFGHCIDIDYVSLLLESCGVSLEKLIIDPYMPPPHAMWESFHPYVTMKHKVREPHEIMMARDDAKQLKSKLPAGAKLVIL